MTVGICLPSKQAWEVVVKIQVAILRGERGSGTIILFHTLSLHPSPSLLLTV